MSGEYDWKGPFVATGAKTYYRLIIEKHLMDAIDLMASTLETPDPRIWDHLKIYMPKESMDEDDSRSLPRAAP